MSILRPARHLACTIALDPARSFGQRLLGKLLGSSLLRTWFSGDVVIFRNTEEPLFAVERAGLTEVFIETPDFQAVADQQEAWRYKFRVREYLDVSGYAKVLFIDADCLALRNLDHLLEGSWDIRWYPESRKLADPVFNCFLTDEEIHRWRDRPGANSGTLAVRAVCFHDVMAEWERIDLGATTRFWGDPGGWNRGILTSVPEWSSGGFVPRRKAPRSGAVKSWRADSDAAAWGRVVRAMVGRRLSSAALGAAFRRTMPMPSPDDALRSVGREPAIGGAS